MAGESHNSFLKSIVCVLNVMQEAKMSMSIQHCWLYGSIMRGSRSFCWGVGGGGGGGGG